MIDDYDRNDAPETDNHYENGTTYKDYAKKGKNRGKGSDAVSALTVLLYERTIIPVAKPIVGGNTRLFTYAMYPLVGLLIGLLLIVWVNIGRILMMNLFLLSLIALVLIFAVQAGLPLTGFGKAADALFSGRRREDQLRILVSRVLRPSGMFAAFLYAALMLIAYYYLILSSIFAIWRLLFAMLAVFVLSRALASLLTLSLPPLEPEEDGDMKTLKLVQMILYVVIAVSALGLILTGMWAAFISVALILLVSVLCHSHFKSRFHGITPSMSIFMAAVAELVGLLVLLLPLGTFLW